MKVRSTGEGFPIPGLYDETDAEGFLGFRMGTSGDIFQPWGFVRQPGRYTSR